MSDQTDLKALYSNRILALSADIPHHVMLTGDAAIASSRSPICGSQVTVSLIVENGIITQFGQNVKACALGQASAAILGQQIIGCTPAQISAACAELENMLKNNGPVPAAPFEEYEILLPAREFKNRHASILLPLLASIKACADQ